MYNRNLRIPRITPAKLGLLNDIAPGLQTLVDIPMLTTRDEVCEYVLGAFNRSLEGYEYVSEILNLTLDESTQCWEVRLLIRGD